MPRHNVELRQFSALQTNLLIALKVNKCYSSTSYSIHTCTFNNMRILTYMLGVTLYLVKVYLLQYCFVLLFPCKLIL